MRSAAGVSLGQALWTVAASSGIAGLIHPPEPAVLILKYSGAAYLRHLGLLGRGVRLELGPPADVRLAGALLAIDRGRALHLRVRRVVADGSAAGRASS